MAKDTTQVTTWLDIIKTHGLALVVSVAAILYIGFQHYEMSKEQRETRKILIETVQNNTKAMTEVKSATQQNAQAIKALSDEIKEIRKPRVQN